MYSKKCKIVQNDQENILIDQVWQADSEKLVNFKIAKFSALRLEVTGVNIRRITLIYQPCFLGGFDLAEI